MRGSGTGIRTTSTEHQQTIDSVDLSVLDAHRITAALREAGVLGCDRRVETASLVSLGSDKSMMSALYRVHLEYDVPVPAPSTLIAKVAVAEPRRRTVAERFSFYEREVYFYERVADSVSFRVPHCYYAAMDPDTHGPVLLLEDLGDTCIPQTLGCTWEQAKLVASELARFHARWWGRVDTLAADVHSLDSVEYLDNIRTTFSDSWPDCERLAGERMPAVLRAVCGRWATDAVGPLGSIIASPATLCHGDLRLDNLRFEDGHIVAFDFQLLARGNGVADLAYFVSQSVPTHLRAGRDAEILDHYLRVLADEGIHYDPEAAMRVYRAAVLYMLIFPVTLYHTFDELPPDGQALTAAMLDRAVATIEELRAWELIPPR